MPTADELRFLQSLPLEVKIAKSRQRIREWVEHWGVDDVAVSFSGEYDEEGLWLPNKKGLGMAHCIDTINRLYGKELIKY